MNILTGIDFFYENRKNHTAIIGYKGQLYGTEKTVDEILMILCEANGRHVKGSKLLFAKATQGHQKLGVLVNPDKEEIYFPTHAAINNECIWINYGKIESVHPFENGHCRIVFKSGDEVEASCTIRAVKGQMKRCRMVLNSLGNPYEMMNVTLIEE